MTDARSSQPGDRSGGWRPRLRSKTLQLVFQAGLAVSAFTSSVAATRIHTALLLPPKDEVPLPQLKQLRHPWTKQRTLARTLADTGLRPDAKVVRATLYLDGGSRFFALRDSAVDLAGAGGTREARSPIGRLTRFPARRTACGTPA